MQFDLVNPFLNLLLAYYYVAQSLSRIGKSQEGTYQGFDNFLKYQPSMADCPTSHVSPTFPFPLGAPAQKRRKKAQDLP